MDSTQGKGRQKRFFSFIWLPWKDLERNKRCLQPPCLLLFCPIELRQCGILDKNSPSIHLRRPRDATLSLSVPNNWLGGGPRSKHCYKTMHGCSMQEEIYLHPHVTMQVCHVFDAMHVKRNACWATESVIRLKFWVYFMLKGVGAHVNNF
jgi:hypothetical protein